MPKKEKGLDLSRGIFLKYASLEKGKKPWVRFFTSVKRYCSGGGPTFLVCRRDFPVIN
jgi:hypothetical protein